MIKDFNFYAPTRVVFGREAEQKIGDLVVASGAHKVLIHYGGGSAQRSGLLDVVRRQLSAAGVACCELGGVVLTIPAAGSEMSSSCVITRDDGLLKRGVNSDLCRCRFAVMNPERTFTLPPYQTAAGATDIMMHTMERYFSKYEDMTLTDAMSEALLRTVKDAALVVMEHPTDYRNRAQIMWASSLAHNDLTECGTEKDFATHKLR